MEDEEELLKACSRTAKLYNRGQEDSPWRTMPRPEGTPVEDKEEWRRRDVNRSRRPSVEEDR